MNVLGLHHVSVAVADMGRAEAFYVGALGLEPHPGKPNWLRAGSGFGVHLMPAKSPPVSRDPARHFALAVERLEDAVARLLEQGLRPFQVNVDQSARHPIASIDDPLDFGIGTVFVEDPDGNAVELVEEGRGIIALDVSR